jgi:hypothetical protein
MFIGLPLEALTPNKHFHLFHPDQASLHSPSRDIVSKWENHEGKKTTAIKVVPLNSYTYEQGWFNTPIEIAILKVDLEGHEPNVSAGGKKLLTSC